MKPAAQRIEAIGQRLTSRAASAEDGTAWARTPPTGGARGTAWEKQIIELAETGEPRFVAILAQHVESGVIRSPRARAALEAAGHETSTRAAA